MFRWVEYVKLASTLVPGHKNSNKVINFIRLFAFNAALISMRASTAISEKKYEG